MRKFAMRVTGMTKFYIFLFLFLKSPFKQWTENTKAQIFWNCTHALPTP